MQLNNLHNIIVNMFEIFQADTLDFHSKLSTQMAFLRCGRFIDEEAQRDNRGTCEQADIFVK